MSDKGSQRSWIDTVVTRLRGSLFGRIAAFASLPLFLVAVAMWKPDTQPPVFDAQVHYNEESWKKIPAKAILATAKDKNIPWLLVGSLPNEGTWRLHEAGPDRVIPMVVPYRSRDERETWFADPQSLAYLEKEIAARPYRGIGEFHLFDAQADTPVAQGMVELARRHHLVLLVRSDAYAIGRLFALGPDLRILWAQAGMYVPPGKLGEMLGRYPNLWIEISHRGDVAPHGTLNPEWLELMLRYPDRILLGSGTYNAAYWHRFRYYIDAYRGWLKQLPIAIAERLAYRNGLDLFGIRAPDAVASGGAEAR